VYTPSNGSAIGERRGVLRADRSRWGQGTGEQVGQAVAERAGAVAKHTASIFVKLGLQPSEDPNRRVLAVLAYLGG